MKSNERNSRGTALDVADHVQLLIDTALVGSVQGVELVMNEPFQDHETVLAADRPWETLIHSSNTVIRDGDRLRMWYFAIRFTHPPGATAEDTYEGFKSFYRRYPYDEFICYAESTDGLHWQKPDLGLYEFAGSRSNNIVLDPSGGRRYHGCCVFVDPAAETAARYKMWSPLQALASPDDAVPAPADGMRRFHSRDGTRWEQHLPDTPDPPGNYDSYNPVFYDVRLGRYVGYKRHWTEDLDGRLWTRYRAIHRWESPDFEQWTCTGEIRLTDAIDESVAVRRQRPADTCILDMYTQPVVQHPSNPQLYLMFPSAFWHWGLPKWGMHHKGGFPDRLDVQLAVSRDGILWQRAGGRRPFLRPGTSGQPDSASVYMFPNPIDSGAETWLYYGGNNVKHGGAWSESRGGIFRARLRRDGFGSADASYAGGELVTVPLRFSGTVLELNVDTGAGGVIRVEILDDEMSPIRGFDADDADELNGNDLHMAATWRGSSEVGSLSGRPVRLRFLMRDAKLYGFAFSG